MAGLGHKTFTRERATISDVQGYLMDQTVMNFASASARSAALPSPDEGMVSVLLDGPGIPAVYIGGTWRNLSALELALTQTLSFAVNSNVFTRMTGPINGTVLLRAGRLYELVAVGDCDADTNGTQFGIQWRGIPGAAVPVTGTGVVVAGGSGQTVEVASRPVPWIVRGLFGVNATGQHTFSPFVRRVSVAGIPTFQPDLTGVMQVSIRDAGPYVAGFPKI